MSNNIRCLQHHNVATVFVAIASVAMLSMLLCMRSYVPQQLAQENSESKALMDEICTEESVGDVAMYLKENTELMTMLSERFSSEAQIWQRPIQTLHAFGNPPSELTEVAQLETNGNWTEAADFAQNQLVLRSVMRGKTSIANINGRVYREGEILELRGGELRIVLMEIGSNYIVVKPLHADEESAIRTIYLKSSSRLASGK